MPILLKSRHCNLAGLTPRELVRHHEEPEVPLLLASTA